jgi:hypothetical protein
VNLGTLVEGAKAKLMRSPVVSERARVVSVAKGIAGPRSWPETRAEIAMRAATVAAGNRN